MSDRVGCDALLDEVDWEWARQWLWCHTYGSGNAIPGYGQERPDHIYARRCITVACPIRLRNVQKTLWLHREVTQRAYGPPPTDRHMADHINGNTLDCRRVNLRWATPSENAHNRRVSVWDALRARGW